MFKIGFFNLEHLQTLINKGFSVQGVKDVQDKTQHFNKF